MEEILEESETVDKVFFPRLGTCAQCKKNEAKYTCPRCGIRTCCLNCVKAHKQVNECDGIRDKTAYKPLSVFTDLDLLSGKGLKFYKCRSTLYHCFLLDYRLLEELGRSTDNLNRDPTKRHTRQNKDLPLVNIV
jgi:hypothetical protein